MNGTRFVRFYPSDWRSGCIGLSPEEEGVYIRVCAHAWETGSRVPTNDAEAASRLMLDVRMWKRLKAKLIAKGKLHVAENGIYSPRAERELKAAQTGVREAQEKAGVGTAGDSHDGEHQNGGSSAPGREPSRPELLANNQPTSERNSGEVGGKSEVSRREVSIIFSEKSSEINTPLKNHNLNLTVDDDAKCARAKPEDLDGLQKKLETAAEGALASPAACPGLLNLSTPQWWLEQGCDLDRDVLPAVAEVARRRAGKTKISTWDYFTNAVTEAKKKRERQLPDVVPKQTAWRDREPQFKAQLHLLPKVVKPDLSDEWLADDMAAVRAGAAE